MPGETTRDVHLRMDVQQTGDTGAPKEQAEQLGALDAAAARATTSLGQLTSAASAYQSLSPEQTWEQQQQAAEQLAGAIIDARLAVVDYATEIERAKAAGEVVTAEQVQKLGELTRAYDDATSAAARHGQSAAAASGQVATGGAAAGQAGGQVRSLQDALNQGIPAWGRYAGAIGLALSSFKEGYQLGSQLRDTLNGLGRALGLGDIADELVRMTPAFLAWQAFVNKLYEAGSGAQTAANELQILRAAGIDPVGMSAEQVRTKVDELGRAMQKHRNELSAQDAAYRKWLSALELSRTELDKGAKQFETFVTRFAAANKQLTSQDLKSIFGTQLQQILDLYARLGTEAPPQIAKLAGAWGVLTSAQQTALEQQRTLVAQYTEAITGVAAKTQAELTTSTQALISLIGGLKSLEFPALGGPQVEAARGQIQQLIDSYRAAGISIPAELTRVADAFSVTIAASERVETLNVSLERTASAAGAAASQAGAASTAMAGLAQGADAAGAGSTAAAAGMDAASASTQVLTRHVDEAGRVSWTLVDAEKTAEQAFMEWAFAGHSVADSLSDVTDEATSAAGTVPAVGTALGKAATDATSAGESLGDVGKKAAASEEALAAVGDQAGSAATGLGSAADAQDRVGTASEAAKAGLVKLRDEAALLKPAADAAGGALDQLAKTAETVGQRGAAALQPIMEKLVAIATAARTAAQEVKALASGEGASPGSG